MTIRMSVVVVASVFALGCGGAKKEPANASDTMDDASDTMGDASDDVDDTGADGVTDDAGDAGTDGIKRDADGDGEEDESMACSDMPETRCKISSSCAWSTDGKCVEAGGM